MGFTSGYFDIMHPGHVMMLEECKQYCDHLIVAVNEYKTKISQPDGRIKNEPIWSPDERLLMVKSNKYVDDEVFRHELKIKVRGFLKSEIGLKPLTIIEIVRI